MVSKIKFQFVGKSWQRPCFHIVVAASVASAGQMQCVGIAAGQPAPGKDDRVANVRTFGAAGDGAANDTAAFNAALASLAKAGGGQCLLPEGIYFISATTKPAITSHVSPNVHLVGEGREVSILKIAGMSAGILLFWSGDNRSVEDLTIDIKPSFDRRKSFH